MDLVSSIKRSAVVAALALLCLPVSSLGDLEHDLSGQRATATDLRSAIAAETKRINATNAGVRAGQVRLAGLQSQGDTGEAQLAGVQHEIVAARNRLTRLENRLHDAARALTANLVAAYKDEDPD